MSLIAYLLLAEHWNFTAHPVTLDGHRASCDICRRSWETIEPLPREWVMPVALPPTRFERI